MRALLIFGMKFGEDNKSLIDLGKKIADLGHSVTFAHWNDAGTQISPDVIIAHSFGVRFALAKAAIRLSLKYIALIDPVDPAWWPVGFSHYWPKFEIPSNIEKCESFTRAFNFLPPAGKVAKPHMAWDGINASHAAMPSHPFVCETILSAIKSIS